MAKAKKQTDKNGAVMTVADLALVVQANDRGLRETIDHLATVVAESFMHAAEQLEKFRSETEDRFQSVEMKILGVNNRIDILIDRTPSREEFGRLEGRVAVLETRRRR